MADSFIRLINLFDDNIDGIPSVLCSRLFSAHDNDDNVSPDSTDPRVITSADSEIEWPKKEQFNAENIFNKVFCNDIKILQGMLQIWESHKIPKPVKFEIESSMASIGCKFTSKPCLGFESLSRSIHRELSCAVAKIEGKKLDLRHRRRVNNEFRSGVHKHPSYNFQFRANELF